jgi:hypothetical protein
LPDKATIHTASGDSLTVVGESRLYHYTITLQQYNDMLVAKWKIYNTIQTVEKRWNFHESHDQEQIVRQMIREINEEATGQSWDELNG